MRSRVIRSSLLVGMMTSLAAFGADVRLRDVIYSADEVYRLPAYRGYDVDLQFQPDEHFVGLGTGDLRGLSFHAQGNHLFIKPKAAAVHTNITVLTDRRVYHFDYVEIGDVLDESNADVLYALRFLYPPVVSKVEPVVEKGGVEGRASDRAKDNEESDRNGNGTSARNADYWYCGAAELEPAAAWDDGVHTHLRFGLRQEMPALFLSNDDGSESLLNFHIENNEVVIHRLVRRLVLRRGALRGCIVNRGYSDATMRRAREGAWHE